jgi:nicotinamide-nucleotide amidase
LKAEIIAVGTELLLGQINNTNARYLSEKLAELGIDVFWHTAVGDNAPRLEEAFRLALSRSDLIIFCGGLGPTLDDLTKETVAAVLELSLEKDREWEERLEKFFVQLGRHMTENNRKQAYMPKGAELVVNDNGTAPGLWLEWKEKIIVLLPGPPRELEPMFSEKIVPRLIKASGIHVIFSRVLKVAGLGESAMEEAINDLIKNQSNPTIAPLAKHTEVHLRLTAKAGTREEAENMLSELEEKVRERLGLAVYGSGEETMADAVACLLSARKMTLAVAESCTGGLLAHMLTNVPGSSEYFLQGVVVYSNRAKMGLLKIRASLLREYGAVSEETARAMAESQRRLASCDLALAITGIAGPTGATDSKPVGLVFIALAGPDGVNCRRFNFWGKRETIKERAAVAALNMLRLYLARLDG